MNHPISEIAKQAFIYGYPMVDLYHILYKYVADKNSPEYKAPLSRFGRCVETRP